MKEVHKMYIEVLEEEIKKKEMMLDVIGNDDNLSCSYIKGLQFALDKAKGILPL